MRCKAPLNWFGGGESIPPTYLASIEPKMTHAGISHLKMPQKVCYANTADPGQIERDSCCNNSRGMSSESIVKLVV